MEEACIWELKNFTSGSSIMLQDVPEVFEAVREVVRKGTELETQSRRLT